MLLIPGIITEHLTHLHSLRNRVRPGLRYKLKLLQNRVPRDVAKVYKSYKEHPESRGIVGRLDAAVLYNQIRRYRPNHCVDLGLGLGTTATIASMAMEANGFGKVTSLEDLDWIAELAQQLMPKTCKDRVTIVRCDHEDRHYFGEKMACYRFTPEIADIDFVIVDGPPTEWIDEAGNVGLRPCGDLIEFLPYLKIGCRVFIDGREPSVQAYRRHLGHLFHIRESRFNYTLMELHTLPSFT